MEKAGVNPLELLSSLSGIGPKTVKKLEQLAGGDRLVDLALMRPTGLTMITPAADFQSVLPTKERGHKVAVPVHILKHTPKIGRAPYRILVEDDRGTQVTLVFFHGYPGYLRQRFPLGKRLRLVGIPEYLRGALQIVHPEARTPEDPVELLRPKYSLGSILSNQKFSQILQTYVEEMEEMTEWLPPSILEKYQFPNFKTAIWRLHHPRGEGDLLPNAPHIQRLAFDELMAGQLILRLHRTESRHQRGYPFVKSGTLIPKLREALSFSLTGDQEKAITDIFHDLRASKPMMRILQGDVGSGKTIVCIFAMLRAVENGRQACLMAPTEILAKQHRETVASLAAHMGIKVLYLSGREKGKKRDYILERLASGKAHIVIGTHALFQKDVHFASLGLIVIDEQHRFGVQQRLDLLAKGRHPHVLSTTATPIPRTLFLAYHNDMDVSSIRQKPPGRQEVITRILPVDRLAELTTALRRDDQQVYWVVPRISEEKATGLVSAEERHAELVQVFDKERVGILHGAMVPADKERALRHFVEGKTKILVATTVIEVGVDVPSANIMIVEHAERFGLAQLHQLRGRVGRGGGKGTCILLYAPPLSAIARERFALLRQSSDGFFLAERDMALRGAGDILGTKQTGFLRFRFVNLQHHASFPKEISSLVRTVVEQDPSLSEHNALKLLLSVFGHAPEANRLLSA